MSGLADASALDFPTIIEAPRITYTLASTPRSGSTLLSLLMWRSGLLGAPLEYLNPNLSPRLKTLGPVQHWRDVLQRRTSPNGVFRCKVFVYDLYRALKDDPNILDVWKPGYIIYLERRDRVAQAVSYYKAMSSGVWFKTIDTGRPTDYSFVGIKKAIDMLDMQRKWWKTIFERTNVTPHLCFYEDIVQNPVIELLNIINHMQIPLEKRPDVSVPLPETQRDADNRLWKLRFIDQAMKIGIDVNV